MAKYPGVSMSVIRRLPRYHRFLESLAKKDVERISSQELAELIGVTASQIRQDLNCFGGFGQQGYGYNVANLYEQIGIILGVPNRKPAILMGAGNLGLALANHMHFEDRGFQLIGIFDSDSRKIGIKVGDLIVEDVARVKMYCQQQKPEVAILCVPEEGVAELSRELVALGIKGFWNFSHYDMSLDFEDDNIILENVHLADSLMTLSFQVEELDN